jgi:WD40 repeat protein
MTHDDAVYSVAVSGDGDHIVSSGADNTARVWDVSTGIEVARLTLESSINSVGFSPDGKYIVSGSSDGNAYVWFWQIEDLIEEACTRLPRNLTPGEWAQYVSDQRYRATCINLPVLTDITATP